MGEWRRVLLGEMGEKPQKPKQIPSFLLRIIPFFYFAFIYWKPAGCVLFKWFLVGMFMVRLRFLVFL